MCWGHLPQKGKRGCHFVGVQSTNVKTDTVIRAVFRYFVGTWWRFVLQHHSWLFSAGCPWKPCPSPWCALPTSLQGCWQVGAQHGPPCWGLGVATQAHGWPALAPQGHGGIPTSLPPPAPAQPLGEVGGRDSLPAFPPCHAAASSARGEVSPGVTKSPLLTSCYQAGFSITFSSVSLVVRS